MRTRLFVVTVAFALSLLAKSFGQLATGPLPFPQSDPLATDGPSGSGTGFFVDPSGFLITCAHVVNGTGEIKVIISNGEILSAKIYRIDIPHDLGLLKVEHQAPAVVPVPSDAEPLIGDRVLTLGFPVPSVEGFNPKLTDGIISSLTGVRDNPDDVQITVPVQPGNSGGALISENGTLLGVVAARANEETFYAQSSSLPQNISYAKKSALVRGLIQNSGLHPVAETASDRASAIKNLVQATGLVLAYGAPNSMPAQRVALQTTPPPAQTPSSHPTMVEFVKAYVESGNFTDPNFESSFYADSVDYFDNGVVSKAFVAQDVFKYDQRWPLRRYWVTSGPLVSIADPARDIVKAVVRLEFKVQNPQKQVVGSCENTIYIRDASSNPKVISVRSKMLSRQEFPLHR